MVFALAGCGMKYESGPPAPQPQPTREYEMQKEEKTGYDITPVVDFIKHINESLDEEDQIKDYNTSYDKDTNTVYVYSGDSTIAFKMDDEGNVLYASCTGNLDEKATIGRAIANVLMYGSDRPVEALFRQIEEKQWLNTLNTNVVKQKLNSDFKTSLDTSLPDWTVDTSGALDTHISMPLLTTELEQAGLRDLSDYYESPTLPEFWTRIGRNDMLKEIEEYKQKGNLFKDIEIPETTIETPNLTNLLPDNVIEMLRKNELDQPHTSDIDSGTGAICKCRGKV